MQANIKKRNEGFTIIEVLIVLAIAGLILLIVFLAVPALQRNQRNTSRKNDVARVGGAATEFVSNNNGTLPSSAADAATIATNAGKLSQYDFITTPTNLTVAAGAATVANPNDVNKMIIVTGALCNGTSGDATNTNATSRQMAILYSTETGTAGTFNKICTSI